MNCIQSCVFLINESYQIRSIKLRDQIVGVRQQDIIGLKTIDVAIPISPWLKRGKIILVELFAEECISIINNRLYLSLSLQR